jgi:phosphopantothenoylcysteine synthetase/decarboxylase
VWPQVWQTTWSRQFAWQHLPVAVVPAMNQQMYRNAATQHNLETLASRGL